MRKEDSVLLIRLTIRKEEILARSVTVVCRISSLLYNSTTKIVVQTLSLISGLRIVQ